MLKLAVSGALTLLVPSFDVPDINAILFPVFVAPFALVNATASVASKSCC